MEHNLYTIIIVGGVSVVSLIVEMLNKSKCTHIECGCLKIDRDIESEMKVKESQLNDSNNNDIKI